MASNLIKSGPEQMQKAKVIDLKAHKQKRLVLDAFDRLKHEKTRTEAEKRAEIERKARNQF